MTPSPLPSAASLPSSEAPVVSLDPIPQSEAPVLANLLQLYAHDFSEHVPVDLSPSGRFEIPFDQAWWTDPGRSPFFLRSGGKLCGFALVKRGSRLTGAPDVLDVAEFFVVRGMRKRGVGADAALALFRAFPGRWEVRVRRSNAGARAFWSRVVGRWAGRTVSSEPWTVGGVDWDVFRLESPAV
ncbi:MAG TPA: GNAT family N-acetyltransferase [Polyangiaceae bacterium]